jgi:signal transduction histidine kinase
MAVPLRVLIVEDKEDDAALLVRELAQGGYAPAHQRVDTARAMELALTAQPWDLVIADYAMPSFSGTAALELLTASGLDIPFIVVSGAIGEETAVAAMKAGAHDYLMKSALGRLVPAVRRELQDAEVRRSKRASEQALREANLRLRALSSRVLEIQETERRQLARELHDEIGQALTAVKINLQALLPHLRAGAGAQRIEDSIEIVDDVLAQARNLSLKLRPAQLDDLGLPAALRWYLDRQARIARVAIHFDSDGLPARFRPEIETACFRIAQEAVTNALRHGRPGEISVRLTCEGPLLHLCVRDNGAGFDVGRARNKAIDGGSLGLLSMEERATLAGGRAEFRSAPGNGAEVHAWFDEPARVAR